MDNLNAVLKRYDGTYWDCKYTAKEIISAIIADLKERIEFIENNTELEIEYQCMIKQCENTIKELQTALEMLK